jgi:hypothetical protein
MKLRGSLSTTIRLIGRHVEYMRKKFREKIGGYEEGYQSCLTAMCIDKWHKARWVVVGQWP